jgi:ABC-type taurine transport system substrate-binding protein
MIFDLGGVLNCVKNNNKTFYRIATQKIAGIARLDGAKYIQVHKTLKQPLFRNRKQQTPYLRGRTTSNTAA